MIRIMPDMQVSPLGGILMWLLIIVAAAGAVLALGPGGAFVWIVATVVFFAVVYWILSKIGKAVF